MAAAGCGAGSTGPNGTASAHRASTTTSTSQGLTPGPYGAPTVPGSSASTSTSASPTSAPPTTAAPQLTTTTTLRPTTTTTAPTTTTSRSTTTTTAQTASATATSGGLTVTLSATPASAPVGTSVQFTIKASESHAPGALVYQLQYGDGSSDQNTAPTTCRGGAASPAQQTWQLSHRYAKKGTFFARVTVKANCTPDQATATVTVTVS